ncbi:MAG: choice-of-anchor Q domain-containing protein [Saprospiraceae bacterium]
MTNCIIWEEDIPIEQILYNGNFDDWSIHNYNLDHCLISVDACDIPGGESACETNTNFFNTYPLFRDTANNDFRLLACSPFINAGVLYDASSEDILGNDRIQEGQIDLGAYETPSYRSVIDTLVNYIECFGDSTGQVNTSTLNAMQPITYQLFDSTNNELISANASGIFGGMNGGTYYLISIDDVGCSDTINFQIEQPMPLTLVVSNNNYVSEQEPGAIFIDSVFGGTQPYSLFFEDDSLSGLLIEDLLPGTYLVSVEDSLGCSQDTLVEILLINSTNEIFDISREISLSPNPSSSSSPIQLTLKLEITIKSNVFITIIDALGRVVEKKSFPSYQNYFPLNTPTQSGIYFITIRAIDDTGNAFYGLKKLVVTGD